MPLKWRTSPDDSLAPAGPLITNEGPRHRALIRAAADLDCVVVTPVVILTRVLPW